MCLSLRQIRYCECSSLLNHEIRPRSTWPPVTQTIKTRRLKQWKMLHNIALSCHWHWSYSATLFAPIMVRTTHAPLTSGGIDDPRKEWRRPRGHPRKKTVEQDVKQQNIALWHAWARYMMKIRLHSSAISDYTEVLDQRSSLSDSK